MALVKIRMEGLSGIKAFCHATVAGDFIFVSGTLGTVENSMELVPGGVGAQTRQTLRNIEEILRQCGATLKDIAKLNVYLRDINNFADMNEAYLAVMGDDVPARITIGGAELALGADVEIDCIAYRPGV